MTITIILTIILLIGVFIFVILNHPKFGQLPYGEGLEKIKQSPHYKDGKFQNQSHTPDLAEGENYFSVAKEYFFKSSKNVKPIDKIPSIKTDLLHLDKHENILVWFGHSSYFMQIDGKTILVDPVFCGYASPFSFSTKAFGGTDIYTCDDMPEIDFLFISHDHWDHLDHATIVQLKPKIKTVICGLGVAAHLEHWGYDMNKVIEKDWNETIDLGEGFIANTVPARHFSGRGLKSKQSLWLSYVLQTPTMRIFIGGDSGYDQHFSEIGKTFGPFDLVILENGQYDKSWKYIHLMPDEILQAAKDLNAKRLLTVHHSKFALGNHAWNEPLVKLLEHNKVHNISLMTPMIGETVYLKDTTQVFSEWWEDVK
jgi:L-ascorbate metabolism protein UlaG (beta-lactamase superfamily)